ncbi:MAG TPA: hydrogen peroxide-dependent heme synthase [Solirubrobacteraceae bacterium]|nr:hydrogen peroxide-dependent heme synthase [Solirubrobacteraceae bacterium]
MSTSSEGHTYTVYAAYQAPAEAGTPAGAAAAGAAAEAELSAIPDVTLRGAYHLTGFRAEADVMVWLTGTSADAMQDAITALRLTPFGRSLVPYWSAIGVHRDAEFNRAHIPAFLAGEEPHKYLCVYPYVRSLEWYLLPADERREMLAEHGRMGRDYPDVRANTVSSFALGDYEWLLAFEADELERIVDVMRHLRGAQARRHTREELPFLTGIRKPLAEIAAALG